MVGSMDFPIEGMNHRERRQIVKDHHECDCYGEIQRKEICCKPIYGLITNRKKVVL